MSPGGLVSDPISALSLGLALMFGTADFLISSCASLLLAMQRSP